jgi:hypothetical protein
MWRILIEIHSRGSTNNLYSWFKVQGKPQTGKRRRSVVGSLRTSPLDTRMLGSGFWDLLGGIICYSFSEQLRPVLKIDSIR